MHEHTHAYSPLTMPVLPPLQMHGSNEDRSLGLSRAQTETLMSLLPCLQLRSRQGQRGGLLLQSAEVPAAQGALHVDVLPVWRGHPH